MNRLPALAHRTHALLDVTRKLDFLAPLLLRLFLAPVFISAGWNKATGFESTVARPLAVVGIPAAQRSLDNSAEAGKRLEAARGLLREHGRYQWLTERGNFVILNNGIEFAATYFLMLLVLFFHGAGRYFSLDYWLAGAAGRDRQAGRPAAR